MCNRDQVDPYYAEEVRVPGLMMDPLSKQKNPKKRHSNKNMYSCLADTTPFAMFGKAANFFVAGSPQALFWVCFHYLIKILIS